VRRASCTADCVHGSMDPKGKKTWTQENQKGGGRLKQNQEGCWEGFLRACSLEEGGEEQQMDRGILPWKNEVQEEHASGR